MPAFHCPAGARDLRRLRVETHALGGERKVMSNPNFGAAAIRSPMMSGGNKVAKITLKQAEDVAKQKLPDLNANSLEAAVRMVKGTARSMGIEVDAS